VSSLPGQCALLDQGTFHSVRAISAHERYERVRPHRDGRSGDTESLIDPECFSLIVDRHATSVFGYMPSRVDRSSSEDLLADVFEAASRARPRYDTRYEDCLPWLLGITTNMIRHHRRSAVRHESMVGASPGSTYRVIRRQT
jgi:sigma-70-like protein